MGYFAGLETAKRITDVFMSNKPLYAAYTQFMADVMRGSDTLSALDREAIALRVSAINNCHYCVGSHRAAMLAFGSSPAELDAAENGTHTEGMLGALLQLSDVKHAT